ncbi:hypothetical protein [Salana multivorans]|uniref:hypothetical protein n=1 Tax=Salana multivorans TaxID=120377 RepID=UPI0011CE3706|nr:hypothetical protein [Salana multivorans]
MSHPRGLADMLTRLTEAQFIGLAPVPQDVMLPRMLESGLTRIHLAPVDNELFYEYINHEVAIEAAEEEVALAIIA